MTEISLKQDVALGVTVPSRHARGRAARIGPALDTILANHGYPPLIEQLLAEALVLTALLGALLKDPNGQLTMQAQTENGIIELLVCDYLGGELRGYVRHDPDRLAEAGPNPGLFRLFGKGYLAITFDLAVSGERYQGVVPLEGESLTHACENYFARSEQVPTLIRVAVRSNGPRCTAGGLLVQHLPEGEEGKERLHAQEDHPDWAHVSIMAGSVRREELVDPVLHLEQLVWRLFHEEEEIRVEPLLHLERGCRCTVGHYKSILSRFGEEELSEMRDEDGLIPVDCAFCSRVLRIPV